AARGSGSDTPRSRSRRATPAAARRSGTGWGTTTTPTRRPRWDLFDRQDLDGVAGAGVGHDLDVLADFPSQQRAPHRRLVADPPLGRVGLGRPDDAVALLGSAVLVEAHRAAEPHHAAGRAGLDDPAVLDDLLQLL